MLIDIKAFILDTGRHSKAVKPLDAKEENEAASCSPEVDDKDAEAFSPKEAPAMTIKSAVARREKSGHQRAENTTDAVN